MARLLWVGIGAAGGIYAYRRGQQAWDRAQERGVGGTAAVLAATTTSALHALRSTPADERSRHPRRLRRDIGVEAGGETPHRGRRPLRHEPAADRPAARTASPGRGVLVTVLRNARSSARPKAGTLG